MNAELLCQLTWQCPFELPIRLRHHMTDLIALLFVFLCLFQWKANLYSSCYENAIRRIVLVPLAKEASVADEMYQ